MRVIGVLVLLVGIGLAGGALYYANKVFAQFQNQQSTEIAAREAAPATVPVIVAAKSIEYGQQIEEPLIRVIDWPANSVPQGAFASPEDLVGDIMSERRVALRPMEPGEPILEAKVSGFGEESRIAMMLGEGRRAFSLPIDAVSGVSGFVSPGDRVDILMTETIKGNLMSRVVMENVLVIAVDQRAQSTGLQARVGRTATVDVSARDAQKLALAQQVGRLSLTLRGAASAGSEVDARPVDLRELRGDPEEEEAAPSNVVRVRRGGRAETVELD